MIGLHRQRLIYSRTVTQEISFKRVLYSGEGEFNNKTIFIQRI